MPVSVTQVPSSGATPNGGRSTWNANDVSLANEINAHEAQTFSAHGGIVTLDYVDWKKSVRAASTANVALGGLQTVDGVSLNEGERVLLKNQTLTVNNGIYVASAGTWLRATDANNNLSVGPQIRCIVQEGTQAGTVWFLNITGAVVLGTTPLTWNQVNYPDPVYTSTTRPLNPPTGLTIFESDTGQLKVNAGTPSSPSWQDSVIHRMIKDPVRAAAAGNVNVGTGGLSTIDGIALSAGDRVLLFGQTAASQNGIYVAASGAWSRAYDMSTSAMIDNSMLVMVNQGTTYGQLCFQLTTTGVITLGSTGLAFSQFPAGGGGGGGSPATVSAIGSVEISDTPAVSATPIAVGINNASYASIPQKIHASDLMADHVAGGAVPATSANLQTTVPSQTLYINASRVVTTADVNHSFTLSKDTYVDVDNTGTLVYQAVNTGAGAPALGTGNLRLFKVVSNATAITAVTDLRTFSPFAGHIDGLNLAWVSPGTSGSNISASAGSVYVPGLGQILNVPSTITTVTGTTTLSANTVYYVYVFSNSGVPTLEISTTVPFVYFGTAAVKTGDYTRRWIGMYRTESTPRIVNFYASGDRVTYREGGRPAYLNPFAATTVSTAKGAIDLGPSSLKVVPPNTRHALLTGLVAFGAGGSMEFGNSEDSGSVAGGVGIFEVSNESAWTPIAMPLDANLQFQVWATGTISGGAYLQINGYLLRR